MASGCQRPDSHVSLVTASRPGKFRRLRAERPLHGLARKSLGRIGLNRAHPNPASRHRTSPTRWDVHSRCTSQSRYDGTPMAGIVVTTRPAARVAFGSKGLPPDSTSSASRRDRIPSRRPASVTAAAYGSCSASPRRDARRSCLAMLRMTVRLGLSRRSCSPRPADRLRLPSPQRDLRVWPSPTRRRTHRLRLGPQRVRPHRRLRPARTRSSSHRRPRVRRRRADRPVVEWLAARRRLPHPPDDGRWAEPHAAGRPAVTLTLTNEQPPALAKSGAVSVTTLTRRLWRSGPCVCARAGRGSVCAGGPTWA